MSEKYFQFRKQQMQMLSKFFCLPRNCVTGSSYSKVIFGVLWIFQWISQYLERCISQWYIYKTLKGIRKIQFVSELTIFLNLQVFKFHESSQRKKLKLSKLEYYSLCEKVKFSAIHPTHITIYSFWRTMFSWKVL